LRLTIATDQKWWTPMRRRQSHLNASFPTLIASRSSKIAFGVAAAGKDHPQAEGPTAPLTTGFA